MTTIHAGAPPLFRRKEGINLTLWGAYLGAGVAAGVAGGVMARVAMRIVTLLEGGVPNFTLFGTLGILFLFTLPGLLVGALCLALVRFTALRTRTLFVVLAAGLVLLLIAPLYSVATGDLPNATNGHITLLMLIFVPVPLVMAWVAVYGGGWIVARQAERPAKRLPMGVALATVVLALAAFVSVMGSLSGAQRHPQLVNRVFGSAGVDFTAMADQLRGVGLLIFAAYMVLALWALWRQPQSHSVRMSVLLVLTLPALLLTAGTWGPNSPLFVGSVRALGTGALLALFLIAGGFSPARRLVVAAVVAWAVVALPQVSGGVAASTAWLVWGMLAVTLMVILIQRWTYAEPQMSRTSTILLALFALVWLGIWAAAMVTPALQLRGMTPFVVATSVKLFWLPWLLLPAALLSHASDGD